jgi:hypothetical protein
MIVQPILLKNVLLAEAVAFVEEVSAQVKVEVRVKEQA